MPNWLRKVTFSILPLFMLLATIELAERIYFYQKHALYPLGLVQIYAYLKSKIPPPDRGAIRGQESYFVADPVLGYKYEPGKHENSIVHKEQKLVFQVTIGADGYRVTSANPAAFADKPVVAIYGCSFTWGEGVNDEEAFPWLLQRDMPGVCVRNLAAQAYGSLQALLQLQDAIARGERLPEVAVFMYNHFHQERNNGDPAYLYQLTLRRGSQESDIRYPRAFIDAVGNFQTDMVSLDQKLLQGKPASEPWNGVLISKIIFQRIMNLCREHGIQPVFVIQTLDGNDEVAAYAREIGFPTIDVSVDLDAERGFKYRNYPFDGHPNKLAHAEYERKLLPFLLGVLEK